MNAGIDVLLSSAEGYRIMDEVARLHTIWGSPAAKLATFLERVPAGTVAVVLADNTEWIAMGQPPVRRWARAGGRGVSLISSADLVSHADRLMDKTQRRAARRAVRALRSEARALRATRRAER